MGPDFKLILDSIAARFYNETYAGIFREKDNYNMDMETSKELRIKPPEIPESVKKLYAGYSQAFESYIQDIKEGNITKETLIEPYLPLERLNEEIERYCQD
jgi:hypothetical protein